jgi:hypothetical protein
MDTPVFYAFLLAHIISLIVGFGAVLATDFLGLQWMRKKITSASLLKFTGFLQKLVWLGWIGLVISGIGLIIQKGYIDNLTQIKLFFVALVGLNGIFLHRIKKMFTALGDRPMPAYLKFRITLASLISQVGWWGAISIGFVHRHIQHDIPWPSDPITYMLYIGGAFLSLYLLGELFLRKPHRYSKGRI